MPKLLSNKKSLIFLEKAFVRFLFDGILRAALIGKLISNNEKDSGRFLIERKRIPDMGNHVERNMA